MLKGCIDALTLRHIDGWSWDDAEPGRPVSLLVTDDGVLMGRVLANRYRPDLESAGIGTGRHAFSLAFTPSLLPSRTHVVRVQREPDGADIPGSPFVLEPARAFDDGVEQVLDETLSFFDRDEDVQRKIRFLAGQLDRTLQRHADRDSARAERADYDGLKKRWARREPEANLDPGAVPARRALFIDDQVPRADRDAGSNAILSHIRSVQRLGYDVTFVTAGRMDIAGPELDEMDSAGIRCCRAPFYASVEEVLLRQSGAFDVVYLHRVTAASRYGALVRHYNPRAVCVYSVADLHHLRLGRQAQVEKRPELAAQVAATRAREMIAAASADVVLTHSTHEAAILRQQVGAEKVHTIVWAVAPRPTARPFADRHGIAFIGGFRHQPNRDAARLLIQALMPRVRQRDPGIECLLVGSDLPPELGRICGDGVVALGHVPALADVFDRVRLTVAPLRYGAGVKGKVIESLAAGVPCACTPVAAEGMALPAALQGLIATGVDDMAEQILRLHNDEAWNLACRAAGLAYVEDQLSEARLDSLMRAALKRPGTTLPR